MPHNVYKEIQEFLNNAVDNRKVLVLGVSYRSEVADTRYTPVQVIYENLKRDGADVTLHDFYVSYWEECECDVQTDLSAVIGGNYDTVLFCTGHSQYKENKTLLAWFDSQIKVDTFDTVGVLSKNSIELISKNNRLKVIGRGDI